MCAKVAHSGMTQIDATRLRREVPLKLDDGPEAQVSAEPGMAWADGREAAI